MRCTACDAINTRTRDRCHGCSAVLHPSRIELGPALPRIEPLDDDLPASDWRLDLREDAAPALPELPTLHDAFAPAPMVADPDAPTIPAVFKPEVEVPPAPAADAPPPETAAGSPATAPALDRPPATASVPASGVNMAPASAPPPPRAAAPLPPASAAVPAATANPDAAAQARTPERSPEELAEAKARRRAAVRRSQLRRRTAPSGLGVVDVMVLEADGEMRAQLCTVLEAFGYRTHVAVSVAEAEGLSLRRLYVAAFLGVGGDAQEAAGLCRRLRDAPRGRPGALIAVTDRQRHTDRVRMQLAGADQTIFRPPGRGDVARALEACGLAMPQDPRLAAWPGD